MNKEELKKDALYNIQMAFAKPGNSSVKDAIIAELDRATLAGEKAQYEADRKVAGNFVHKAFNEGVLAERKIQREKVMDIVSKFGDQGMEVVADILHEYFNSQKEEIL